MEEHDEPGTEREEQPSDLFSRAETRAMLEEFRSLIREGVLEVSPENQARAIKPLSEEELRLLDRRLEQIERWRTAWREERKKDGPPTHPTVKEPAPDEDIIRLRQGVVDKVAQLILQKWEDAGEGLAPALRREIIDCTARSILRRLEGELS